MGGGGVGPTLLAYTTRVLYSLDLGVAYLFESLEVYNENIREGPKAKSLGALLKFLTEWAMPGVV